MSLAEIHPSVLTYSFSKTVDIQEKKSELLRLSKEYLSWSDPFSQNLRIWIRKVVTEKIVHSEHLEDRITELFSDIFVNPFTQAPIVNPVLEGDQVWEATTLNECKLYLSNSPFSSKEFQAEKPHAFALALLKSLGDLLIKMPGFKNVPLIFPTGEAGVESFIPLSEWEEIDTKDREIMTQVFWKALADRWKEGDRSFNLIDVSLTAKGE